LSFNQIRDILANTKTIVVFGLSNDPEKPSFRVAAFLKQHRYRIVPVNPLVDKVLGEKSYKSLLDIPKDIQLTVDVVDIFRKSEDVPPIVDQAIQLKVSLGRPLVVWMQLGIVNEEAAKAARQAGLFVVMDRCLMAEHHRLR
jgi:uncharacterized protein